MSRSCSCHLSAGWKYINLGRFQVLLEETLAIYDPIPQRFGALCLISHRPEQERWQLLVTTSNQSLHIARLDQVGSSTLILKLVGWFTLILKLVRWSTLILAQVWWSS